MKTTDEVLFGFLLEHIPDRIYFKDRESRFLRVSRAKAERHGLGDPAQLIGRTDFDLFTAEHAEEALQDEQRILQGGEPIIGKVEKETLPGGETKWALTTKMAFRSAQGEIVGTCGISKDITALKAMEEELARTLAALQAAQSQLVEAEKAQTAARLAAGVAHEVRNPLNILGVGLDFLSAEPALADNAAAGEVLAEMQTAIRHADAVICALMDSSRSVPLDLEKRELNALVEAAVEGRQRELAEGSIRVSKELAGHLPGLSLDAEKIRSVLDDLLLNALAAMTDRGGNLTIRTKLEQIQTGDLAHDPGGRSAPRHRPGDTVVALEIEDTGCGIPQESLQAIFDPFFTTKETGKGTGLGLTVCRKIMELHGGSVGVANRPEGGVKVRLLFAA